MQGIDIVPFEKKYLSRFQDYIHAALHKKHILADERFLDWQYTDPGMLYLALHNDKIVGHFGYRDFLYKVREQSRLVRVAMNLFSLEEYHGAGVGPLLAKEVFNTTHAVLLSGYNEAAFRLCAHLRSTLREAGSMDRFVAVLDAAHPFLKNFAVPRSFPGPHGQEGEIAVHDIAKFDTAFQDSLRAFWERVRHRYPATIERTSAYLLWRFFSHPHLHYSFLAATEGEKLVGYLIYRSEEAEGFSIARIVDFIADPLAERALLQYFLDLVRKNHAAADFMFSGSLYREALKDAGFFDAIGTDFENFPTRFNPVSSNAPFIHVAYDIDLPLHDFYVTKADSDQDRPNPH